jgi:hypothetical protein
VTAAWPWLTVAGLGVFHGLNPAMGWLFAVALGLHRRSLGVVVVSLAPMALGHALSIGLAALAVVALGIALDGHIVRLVTGVTLILWALYHLAYGHRHRVRIGMTAGLAGLAAWSFLMATSHGAGLMLAPALLPLCAGADTSGHGQILTSFAAVGVHTATTLLVTAAIAVTVYTSIDLNILRRSWINFDRLWTGMLVAAGLALILS